MDKEGNLRGGEMGTKQGRGGCKGERVEGRNESEGKKTSRGRWERALIVCGRNAQGLARAPGDSWP